jgi:Tol biopolymer transport system component
MIKNMNAHSRRDLRYFMRISFVVFISVIAFSAKAIDPILVAFISRSSNIDRIIVINSESQEVLTQYELIGTAIGVPLWSPSGNKIMILSQGSRSRFIEIFSLDGSVVSIPSNSQNRFLIPLKVVWGIDDESIYVFGNEESSFEDHYIFKVDLSDGQIQRLDVTLGLTGLSENCGGYMTIDKFDFNGTWRKYLLDLQNASTQLLYSTLPNSSVGGALWSNDCSKIAFFTESANEMAIVIIELNSMGILIYHMNFGLVNGFDWSPDGNRLVLSIGEASTYFFPNSRSTNVTNIYMLDASSGEFLRLTDGTSTIESPRWSPSGQHILYSSNETGKLDIFSYGIECECSSIIYLTQEDVFFPTWSP